MNKIIKAIPSKTILTSRLSIVNRNVNLRIFSLLKTKKVKLITGFEVFVKIRTKKEKEQHLGYFYIFILHQIKKTSSEMFCFY
jgi:hypothetical protein